jgi:hypothetical protein
MKVMHSVHGVSTALLTYLLTYLLTCLRTYLLHGSVSAYCVPCCYMTDGSTYRSTLIKQVYGDFLATLQKTEPISLLQYSLQFWQVCLPVTGRSWSSVEHLLVEKCDIISGIIRNFIPTTSCALKTCFVSQVTDWSR